jgi:hypothetical protein
MLWKSNYFWNNSVYPIILNFTFLNAVFNPIANATFCSQFNQNLLLPWWRSCWTFGSRTIVKVSIHFEEIEKKAFYVPWRHGTVDIALVAWTEDPGSNTEALYVPWRRGTVDMAFASWTENPGSNTAIIAMLLWSKFDIICNVCVLKQRNKVIAPHKKMSGHLYIGTFV